MTSQILALRVSRRAIGVAALADEQFSFTDSRHLTSRTDRAIEAAERYLSRLIVELHPERVALFAPTTGDGVTAKVARALTQTLTASAVPVVVLDRQRLLNSFGTRPVKIRKHLHQVVLDI